MISLTPCTHCTHLRPGGICGAYPLGIPVDIVKGAEHDEPRGDEERGITFELVPGSGRADEARRRLKGAS